MFARGLGGLYKLETLAIGGFCEELETFPSLSFMFKRLDRSLKQIYLYGWTKLNSLPDEIKIFTALTSLWILEFHGIEALPDWLGSPSTLKDLYLNICDNLMYLPTFECLIKLESINCPKLKKRYAKETGAEWFKISHIPNVRIYWLMERSAKASRRYFDVSCQTKMTQNSNNTKMMW